jgi:hypothetical protein
MGKASTNKKVSRAASTGGGRTARGPRPYIWWVTMALVVALGVAGIAFSRQQRRDLLAAGSGKIAPIANKDHWHAAYGIYLCDSFAPAITDQRDPYGIHTHGDGIIHIHPFVGKAAGNNATLKVFAATVGMTITDTELKVPGGKTYREGHDKCGGKPGQVQVKVNSKTITENVALIRLHDNDHITIAFAPAGAELPEPPSVPNLSNLSDVPSSSTVPPATDATGTANTTDTTGPSTTDASPTTTAKP